MAPPTTKPSDAPAQPSKPDAAKPEEHRHNLLDIMNDVKKDAVAPVVNGFAIEPINAGVNVLNGISDGTTWLYDKATGKDIKAPQVGKVGEMDLGKPEQGSAASYTQQILGTASSFLVYAVAGKVAGKVLRTAGELTPLEAEIGNLKFGSTVRGIAQDTRVATVLGATAYAGLRDPKDGESRLSNAASTFVGFSAFEIGNAHLVNARDPLAFRIGQRYTVGALGGMAQTNVSSLIEHHKLADKDSLASSALSGGLLNALMPAGQHAVDRAVEGPMKGLPYTTEATARAHIDAVRALPQGATAEPGSWGNPDAIKAVNRAARADLHTKVQLNDAGPTRIDQAKNTVYVQKGDDALSAIQELAHRNINKDPKYEAAFKSAAGDLHSHDPLNPLNDAAKEKYISTRVEQEIAARQVQNLEAAKLGSDRRVSVKESDIRSNDQYGARFATEADAFVASGGKARPVLDHNAGGGGHGGGHDAGHVVNTVSNGHAENSHGSSTPADGPGGGTGRPGDAAATPRTPEEIAEADRLYALKDWPQVDNPAKQHGTSWETSDEFPRGRKMYWYNWPKGESVNGYDDVVYAQHYDEDLNEVMLIRRNPQSNELSAVKLSNDGDLEVSEDGRNDIIHTSAIERFYDKSASNTPLNKLFDSDEGLTAIKYTVVEGNELIPSGTTYTRFAEPQVWTINNEKIYPTASVDYHDGTGRVDWHQDWPFQTLVTEWPEAIEENGVRYRVSVPQSIPHSYRLFRLTAADKPDGITDVFNPEHPLITDFGKNLKDADGKPRKIDPDFNKAKQVNRQGDKDTYYMTDGSVNVVAHYKGQITKLHIVDGQIRDEDTEVFKKGDGYSEKYSSPWETIFGQANEVKVSPDKATFKLVNGGTVEHYKSPITFNTFKNVDWVYTDPNGDRVIQIGDGAQTRIRMPLGGADTGVLGEPKAAGVQEIGGIGGFYRYYLEDGTKMDVRPDQPGVGVIREPNELTVIYDVDRQWQSHTTEFAKNKLPRIVQDSEARGKQPSIVSQDDCFDGEGQPLSLYDEMYPNGLRTKWGLALERHTYWTGHSYMKIADGTSKDGTWIELDGTGNKVIRDPKTQEIKKIIPEPADYPHLKGLSSPRRIVNASDFPQDALAPAEVVADEEPIFDDPEAMGDDHHHDNDDLLDNPDDT